MSGIFSQCHIDTIKSIHPINEYHAWLSKAVSKGTIDVENSVLDYHKRPSFDEVREQPKVTIH